MHQSVVDTCEISSLCRALHITTLWDLDKNHGQAVPEFRLMRFRLSSGLHTIPVSTSDPRDKIGTLFGVDNVSGATGQLAPHIRYACATSIEDSDASEVKVAAFFAVVFEDTPSSTRVK